MHATKIAELTADVAAVNLANAYANKLLAKLQAFFSPLVGQKIIKLNGTLLAKLQDKLPAFPAEKGNPGQHEHATIMTYKHNSPYSLAWAVKVCWPVPPHSCTYYEVMVYVGDMEGDTLKVMTTHREPWREDFTVAEAVERIDAFEAAKKEADDARGRVYPFQKYVR